MKLEVLDQIHVSWVRADSLRPGDQITVTPEQGEGLLKAHPDTFKAIGGTVDTPKPESKADAAPLNKMEVAPANKAAKRKAK